MGMKVLQGFGAVGVQLEGVGELDVVTERWMVRLLGLQTMNAGWKGGHRSDTGWRWLGWSRRSATSRFLPRTLPAGPVLIQLELSGTRTPGLFRFTAAIQEWGELANFRACPS